MSFCSRVKDSLCRAAESGGGDAFCCGLLFLHAGRERSHLLRTETTMALPLLEERYESAAGRPLPVLVCGSGSVSRDGEVRNLLTVNFAEPIGESRRAILGVFGKWGVRGGVTVDAALTEDGEALRGFISGAFTACGLLSDPGADYHLEFGGLSEAQAAELSRLLGGLDFHPSLTDRGGRRALYFKDGDQIEYLLGYMGANDAMFELSNLRIARDVSNRFNRQLNCDAANLTKSRGAAEKQLEDIRYIFSRDKTEYLSEDLLATAKARLDNDDASLAELGRLLGVGRSGVNHRLRKISLIAADLRQKE